MKKTKFLVIVAALMVCSTTSAQFTSSSRSGSSVSTEGWNTFYFMYSPTTLEEKYDYKDVLKSGSVDLTGLSLGYERAIGLTQSIPLYLKVGGEVKYSFGKYTNEYKDDFKYSFLSVKVPVSVAYDFSVTDNIDILPYTGMYFRINAMGKQKDEEDDRSEDCFSDYDWSRFQVGWQIGADVMFSKRYVAGINYSTDISKLYNEDGEKASSHAINIKLGIVF